MYITNVKSMNRRNHTLTSNIPTLLLVITNKTTSIFFVVCEDGYYGENCKTSCGNCSYMEACDKENGTCYHGCINHFKEPKCDGKKINKFVFHCKLNNL